MSETKIIPSIITSKDADQLNTKLQSELATHLFLFCHYSPIPENPQSKYARFVPGILNLYIFSTDACFYHHRGEASEVHSDDRENEDPPGRALQDRSAADRHHGDIGRESLTFR